MRKGTTKASEFVDIFMRASVARLCADTGMSEADARVIMREVIHEVCQEYGGDGFYLPRDIEFPLEARDREIWNKFNGRNASELAREYKLTERQIRCIISLMRKRSVQLNQFELPGLEPQA